MSYPPPGPNDPAGRGGQYPGGYQPQYYQQQPPPKKSHTLRNVLLIVGALLVLLVGGCVAVVGLAANEAVKQIDTSASQTGGTEAPLTIRYGKAFEVRGFNYKAGWKLRNQLGLMDVVGLRVTNNRDEQDSAIVEIKVWKGSEVVALANCTTEPIAPKTATRLTCSSSDKLPAKWSKITINDSF